MIRRRFLSAAAGLCSLIGLGMPTRRPSQARVKARGRPARPEEIRWTLTEWGPPTTVKTGIIRRLPDGRLVVESGEATYTTGA